MKYTILSVVVLSLLVLGGFLAGRQGRRVERYVPSCAESAAVVDLGHPLTCAAGQRVEMDTGVHPAAFFCRCPE